MQEQQAHLLHEAPERGSADTPVGISISRLVWSGVNDESKVTRGRESLTGCGALLVDMRAIVSAGDNTVNGDDENSRLARRYLVASH